MTNYEIIKLEENLENSEKIEKTSDSDTEVDKDKKERTEDFIEKKIEEEKLSYNKVRSDLGMDEAEDSVSIAKMKEELSQLKNEAEDNSETEGQESVFSNEEKKDLEDFSEKISFDLTMLRKEIEERENFGFTEFFDSNDLDSIIKDFESIKDASSPEEIKNTFNQIANKFENLLYPGFRGVRESGDSLDNFVSMVSRIESSLEESNSVFKKYVEDKNKQTFEFILDKNRYAQESVNKIKQRVLNLQEFR